MPPVVALTICTVFVVVLLRVERRRNAAASGALWVPTVWMVICGSRPLVGWFEPGTFSSGGGIEAGSPLDRWVLIILISLALCILFGRNLEWGQVLKDNSWLVLLYLYVALSILWSEYPLISFRRWMRLAGAVPIALVVLSERSPLKAMESVLRRTAYVLIPVSLLLIKYFPLLGVEYNRWTGDLMWIGVAGQKNGLGLVCALSAFFFIWAFLQDRRPEALLKTRSQTFADASVFAIAIFLLRGAAGAYSATSIAILIIGTASLVLLYRSKDRMRPLVKRLIVGVAVLMLCLPFASTLVSVSSSVLGRDESFTGRTDVWRVALDEAARHPILGAGFGSYFAIQDERNEFWATFRLKTGHNGFLDVYVELGLVGVALLSGFLRAYYGRVLRELSHATEWGVFGACLMIMWLLYNITESDFLKTSTYFWNLMVFITVVFSAPILPRHLSFPCGPAGNRTSFARVPGEPANGGRVAGGDEMRPSGQPQDARGGPTRIVSFHSNVSLLGPKNS